MLHLRESLPQLFDSRLASAELFPPDVFSKNVVLKLPAPLPLKVCPVYYSLMLTRGSRPAPFTCTVLDGFLHRSQRDARSVHQTCGGSETHSAALHTDLRTTLERMTFSPCPPSSSNASPAFLSKPIPSHRQKQIRVLLQVHAIPRLPPHHVSFASEFSMRRTS